MGDCALADGREVCNPMDSPIPPAEAPQLTTNQMRAAANRFRRRIADLQKFDPSAFPGEDPRSDPQIRTLQMDIEDALTEAFGHDTPAYQRYKDAADLDQAKSFRKGAEAIAGFQRGKRLAMSLLDQAAKSLEEKLAELEEEIPPERSATSATGERVQSPTAPDNFYLNRPRGDRNT
jgi:hypothetical protein